MTGRLIAIILWLAAGQAMAQDSTVRPLSDDELRELFIDATASGRNIRTGVNFSEYYAPDGQILGDSGGSNPVTDGCWTIRRAQMCFSYGPTSQRRTLCWNVIRNDKTVIFSRDDAPISWVATVERGNPRGYSAPKPWICELATVQADMISPRKIAE
ncbi:hypothetical protein [Terrarubrum flagellatum]|uniref:hypothetical protein n=1 Tax=Terrirubrum flagellatum TaxID=2895980 RepID=UPI003144EFB0